MAPDVPMPSIRLTDRYVLCDQIGAGGMARVHIGRLVGSAAFARTVAIKRLLPRYAAEPAFRLMLTDEARLAARVRHPNVVQTLEVVAAGDELFLVMEYIDGVPLGRLIRAAIEAGGRVPEPILAAVICQILEGLHAAHEATDEHGAPLAIVHRDISPDNVLVGADGFARVLDFGIAKARSRLHETRDGQLKGKLSYMAPEQLSGKVTHQTDVFAASIVAWEGLCSRRLFQADDDGETIGRVLATMVDPPSTVVPDVAPRLSEIVMRGLARAPADRWATAHEMALAIEQGAAVATPSQIGAWVEAMMGPWLAERRQLVRRVEAAAPGELVVSGARTRAATASPITVIEGAGRRRVAAADARASAEQAAPDASADGPDPRGTELHARPRRLATASDGVPDLRRRYVGRYLIGAAAVGAALVVALVARAPSAAPASAAVRSREAAPTAGPATTPSAQAPAAPSAASVANPATTASAAVHGKQSVAPSHHRVGARPTAAHAAKQPTCDPPYRLGPLGEKVWLKECL